MKLHRLLYLFFITLFTISCGSVEQSMQKELDKVHIGMTIEEFKKAIPKSTVVYFDEMYTCYKLTKRYARFGDPNHFSYETRFFYFKDGSLWKVNEGEKAVDYRIKIDN